MKLNSNTVCCCLANASCMKVFCILSIILMMFIVICWTMVLIFARVSIVKGFSVEGGWTGSSTPSSGGVDWVSRGILSCSCLNPLSVEVSSWLCDTAAV